MKHARLLGLALLNLAAGLVTLGGLYDLTRLELPGHLVSYLSLQDDAVDEHSATLALALLRALGAALTAVGVVALALINAPVRRGSRGALLAVVVLIGFVEGVNGWGMWTVGAPWWAALSFIALALGGSVFLVISGRRPPPTGASSL